MSQTARPHCLHCQTLMEIGYLIDRGDRRVREPVWAPGEPDPLWLGDLLVPPGDQLRPVRTFACPRCGYLESYIPRATPPPG